MPIPELDDLFNFVTSSEDRTTLESLLQRNPAAQAALTGRETVYRAMIQGDDAALNQLTQQQRAAAAAATRPTPASLDLAALDAALSSRVPSMFKSYLDTPEAQAVIDARAESRAKALLAASEGQILGRAANLSDEIYSIRRHHSQEFSEELDTPAFTKFMEDNGGPNKFGSLTKAHDQFVQQKRIDAAIKKGIEEGRAAQQTNEVPGTSLPTAGSPLGAMIRDNAKRTAAPDAGRGDALDAAARAFRQLQIGHMN